MAGSQQNLDDSIDARPDPRGGASTPIFRNTHPFGQKTWTVDEILAFLLAVKIRHGLSDEAFLALMEGENASINPNTSSRLLPVTTWRLSKELQGFIPFHFQYVTFCPECGTILKRSDEPVKQADCTTCGYDLKEALSSGGCSFIVLPVRKQIELYCRRPKFQALVRKFKLSDHGKLDGPLHRGIIDSGHFSLTVVTDGAVLSKWSNTTLLPIFLFFNNIPVSYQCVFPILCALYCGQSRWAPLRTVFFKYLVEELREMEINPILWKYDTGVDMQSLVYVTVCCSDAVEKAKLMMHKGHSGYFSCTYCKYKGKHVTVDSASLYPPRPGTKHIKKQLTGRAPEGINDEHSNLGIRQGVGGISMGDNRDARVGSVRPVNRDTLEERKGKVKYPDLLHKKTATCEWRDSTERVVIGARLARSPATNRNGKKQDVEGVLGLGVLLRFSKFDETGSHTAGLLHVVCEGFFKDIMNLVVGTKGEFGLVKQGGTWDNVERLQKSRTRVSEANYNCKSPRIYSSWRAYDFYQLLMHDVALLFSDEKIMTNENFQNVIFTLSEAVYLLCHGRMTAEIRRQARAKVEEFSEAYLKCLGPDWCTFKFHLFQHAPDLADRHGPAFLWDDFNLERINSMVKRTVTGTRGQSEQAAKHFILRHHSDVLQDPSNYQPSVKRELKKNGFHQEVFCTYDDFITHRVHEPIDLNIYSIVHSEMVALGLCDVHDQVELTRVSRMVRKNVVVLTSKRFKHRGAVRDSYVQVENDLFGQIEEIVFSVDLATFFLVIEKFAKYDALYSKGNRVMHPINQFPYRRTGQLIAVELTDDLFIQKAQISCLVLAEGKIVDLFSPRPNEFFRF